MSAPDFDHPLPSSPEAERAVLGAILINAAAYWRVSGLKAEDFFRDAHREVFKAIQSIATRAEQIDMLTVIHELREANRLDAIGGHAFVSSLVDGSFDIANVERYAEIVSKESAYRRLITLGHSLMRNALDRIDEPSDIAAAAMAKLSRAATADEKQARPLCEVIHETFEALERRMNGEAAGTLTSGFPWLDHHRAIRRTFGAIGCPSQHGKTAFMVNLAEGLGSNGHKVAIFSLESTEEETALRYVSTVGQVSHSRVQDWTQMQPADLAKAIGAETTSHDRAIYLTRRIRDVEGIYAEARRLKAMHGLDVVLIDYFQLVKGPAGVRDREERLAAVSQVFLEMSIDLEVGVYATSQLTEDRKARQSGRLSQSDLKYARAIGESARVVMLFQRPHADDKKSEIPPCTVHFQIEKNNEGLTNDTEFHFDEQTQTLREGDCYANNCRRVQKEQRRELFG